jgi:hypothetical protein
MSHRGRAFGKPSFIKPYSKIKVEPPNRENLFQDIAGLFPPPSFQRLGFHKHPFAAPVITCASFEPKHIRPDHIAHINQSAKSAAGSSCVPKSALCRTATCPRNFSISRSSPSRSGPDGSLSAFACSAAPVFSIACNLAVLISFSPRSFCANQSERLRVKFDGFHAALENAAY